jgi:DNA ligase-1
MKPMLAKRYADQQHKLTYPLYVQPKLNGVRGIYNSGIFQSRDQHIWSPSVVAHITSELAHLPPTTILDGEFYLHGTALQKINGAISVNRNEPSSLTSSIEYHVFDLVNTHNLNADFAERNHLLKTIFSSRAFTHVKPVDTHLVATQIEGDSFFQHFKDLEYEGLMYRTNVPYGLEHICTNKENRWPCLLKRKDWLDERCLIVDVELGEGRLSNVIGALVLRFPSGVIFRAGSGLSDMQRAFYLDVPPIGSYASIRYEMLSLDGVPLKPTIECVYDETN